MTVNFKHGFPGIMLQNQNLDPTTHRWITDFTLTLHKQNLFDKILHKHDSGAIIIMKMFPGVFTVRWRLLYHHRLLATSPVWHDHTSLRKPKLTVQGAPPASTGIRKPPSALSTNALSLSSPSATITAKYRSVSIEPAFQGEGAATRVPKGLHGMNRGSAMYEGPTSTQTNTRFGLYHNIQENFTPEVACGGEPGTLILGFPLNRAGVAPNFNQGATGVWGYQPVWFGLGSDGTWSKVAIGYFHWTNLVSTAGNGDSNINTVSIGGGETLNGSIPAGYYFNGYDVGGSGGDDVWVGVDYWYNVDGTWYFAGTAWNDSFMQFTSTGAFPANYCWLWTTPSAPPGQ